MGWLLERLGDFEQFAILRFLVNGDGQESEPPVVYVADLGGVLYLERPSEIHRYQDVYAAIAAVALDDPASRALIRPAAQVSS